MTPPKGHNHSCWVKNCKAKTHYDKGVWYTFCRSHLQIHGLGPFRKYKRHSEPDDAVITNLKFPDHYDPNTLVDRIPVTNQGVKLASMEQIKAMLRNRKEESTK